MLVTIMKKNSSVKIKSGNDDVFNVGTLRCPVLLKRPIGFESYYSIGKLQVNKIYYIPRNNFAFSRVYVPLSTSLYPPIL